MCWRYSAQRGCTRLSSAVLEPRLKSTDVMVTTFFSIAGSVSVVPRLLIQSLQQPCEVTEVQRCGDLSEVTQTVPRELGFTSVLRTETEARTCSKMNEGMKEQMAE